MVSNSPTQGSFDGPVLSVLTQDACRAFQHYTHSAGARLGLTVRVIIADAFGCLVREWIYGQGISGSNAVQFVGGCRIAWVLRFDGDYRGAVMAATGGLSVSPLIRVSQQVEVPAKPRDREKQCQGGGQRCKYERQALVHREAPYGEQTQPWPV